MAISDATKAIHEAVEQYVKERGITWTITRIGSDCPPFCEDKGKPGLGEFPRKNHIHGDHYQVVLTGKDKRLVMVDFWNSYRDALIQHVKRNPTGYDPARGHDDRRAVCGLLGPSAQNENTFTLMRRLKGIELPVVRLTDVLSCCELSAPSFSFENWCGDYGYDTDSRKAERVYRAVCEQYADLSGLFGREGLERLQELMQEF